MFKQGIGKIHKVSSNIEKIEDGLKDLKKEILNKLGKEGNVSDIKYIQGNIALKNAILNDEPTYNVENKNGVLTMSLIMEEKIQTLNSFSINSPKDIEKIINQVKDGEEMDIPLGKGIFFQVKFDEFDSMYSTSFYNHTSTGEIGQLDDNEFAKILEIQDKLEYDIFTEDSKGMYGNCDEIKVYDETSKEVSEVLFELMKEINK